MTGGPDRPIGDRPGQVVFALLVLACFAAFFITQRLKHTPTAVQQFDLTPVFSPTPAGHIKEERISFKLAAADEVSVAIINASGDVVATLTRDYPVARYKPFSLRWSGREGSARRTVVLKGPELRPILVPEIDGRLAPAGEYRVRVSLHEKDRTVLSPRGFTLEH